MGWQATEVKTVRCTKGLAREFASMKPAPGDREFRDRIADFIKTEIAKGDFRTANFASVYCKETGEEYRLNGKHTSTTLVGMNGEFPTGIMAHLEKYEADTLRDVARLYKTFDSRVGARSVSDVHRSITASDPELEDIRMSVVNGAISGYKLVMSDGNNWKRTHAADDPDELIHKLKKFILFLNGILDGGPKSLHLRRSAVIGAIYLSWEKSQRDAEAFWTAVRDASGANNQDPDRVLNRYLLTTAVRSDTSSQHAKTDTSRAMFVRCIHAWNAWRKNERTDMRYYESSPVPRVL